MNHVLRIRIVMAAAGLLALVTLAACVVPGFGGGGGYGGGYYEPGGYEVGGWAPGYRVGPPRAGARGRAAPSIPHASRGGGHASPAGHGSPAGHTGGAGPKR